MSFDDGAPSPVIGQGQMPGSSASAQSLYFTRKTLYEPNYGIKTANALVPYGWSSSVSVQWGLLSTMYPAAATVTMLSPDGRAKIEIMSTVGYLQMARNGSWIPEGTYLDLYNIFLNYRDAAGYNDYILGVLGYTGTVLNREKPDYEFQLALNAEANSFLAAMSTSGITGKECAGSYEKTAYFITGGDAYEAEVVSTVIMARTINGLFDTYTWTVPITAVFTAYDEEAYAAYADAFTLTVANTSFCGQFLYVVQRNAQYLNEMMHDYLMESVYKPSSSDISGWAGDYSESQQDKWVNAWCDVITERDEYVTSDGSSVKIPTMYDAVYQNGDTIYMGPQADLGSDWQQLSVKPYMQ